MRPNSLMTIVCVAYTLSLAQGEPPATVGIARRVGGRLSTRRRGWRVSVNNVIGFGRYGEHYRAMHVTQTLIARNLYRIGVR
jgi:hypothetical protein